MEWPDLLPGVSGPERVGPLPQFHPHEAIDRVRRQVALRQALDGATLLLLDALAYLWPQSRLPFLGRDASVMLLVAVNLAFVAALIISRKLPEWRARRVAATWCEQERRKLQAGAIQTTGPASREARRP